MSVAVPTRPKVALVTGAGGAIGTAITRHLSRSGHMVVAADRTELGLRRLETQLSSCGLTVEPLVLDVTGEAAVDMAVEGIVRAHGSLDVLVNNAGITNDAALHTMSLEAWETVLRVNLTGPFLLTRAAARQFRSRSAGGQPGGGRIVNISSISGKIGNAGQANYAASKAGLVGLTKVAARELARYGVTVNAIQPGFISSPMTDAMPSEVRDAVLAGIPLGRAGTPDDIAGVVAWLCSDTAAYVTGAVIEVTGGRGM